MFQALFEDPEAQSLFEKGLRASPFVEAAEVCQPLSMEAFRCAELQGFRHPLCLERKLRHTRCVARFFAPEFLERLETCEMRSGRAGDACQTYVADLSVVVSKRLNQHVDAIHFTVDEKRGVASCGLPLEARSPGEYRNRMQCMATHVCADSLSQLERCYDKTNTIDGICAVRTRELMLCMAESTARMYFNHP